MEIVVPASFLPYSQRPCLLFPTGLLKSKPLSTHINTWPQRAFSSVSVYHVVFCIFFFSPEDCFSSVFTQMVGRILVVFIWIIRNLVGFFFFFTVYLYARNGTRLFSCHLFSTNPRPQHKPHSPFLSNFEIH